MGTSDVLLRNGRVESATGTFRTAAYWSVVLLVFSIPWQVSIQIASVGTISKLLGFVAAGVAVVAVLLQGVRHRLTDAHAVVIAFTAWTLLSTSWSLFPADSREAAITSVQLVVMVLLIWEFADTAPKILGVIRAFVGGSIVTAGSVIQQYIVLGEGASRYTGTGAHPNDVAFVLCLAIPLAWYISLRTPSSLERLLGRAYIALALYAVVLTASRSALLVAGLALLIIPISYPALTWRWRLGLMLAIGLSLAVVPAMLPERQIERLATISTELEGGDLNSRVEIWQAALEVMDQEPVTGTGVGAGRRLIATTYGQAEGAHNTYLSVALETGAVGLALFLLVLYVVFRRAAQVRGLERGLIVVIGLCLLVGLLPRHWEDEKALWVMLSIVIAIGVRGVPLGRQRGSLPDDLSA